MKVQPQAQGAAPGSINRDVDKFCQLKFKPGSIAGLDNDRGGGDGGGDGALAGLGGRLLVEQLTSKRVSVFTDGYTGCPKKRKKKFFDFGLFLEVF